MKRLVWWAVRLYPAKWRARYAAEMEALIDDLRPAGGDLWDLVRGALSMQITNLSFWKIVSGCVLAGVLAAGVWSVTLPKRYVSTAVMRLSGTPLEAQVHLQRLQQGALSRSSLSSIIVGQNLYGNERNELPLEDIVEAMRNRDVRIRAINAAGEMTFAVEFRSENPAAAQAGVRAIVTSLAEQNLQAGRQEGSGAANLEVLDPASLPSQSEGPNRLRVVGSGLGAGLAFGLLCGAIFSIVRRKEQWSLRRIGGFAAAGMALGVTIAFLIPNEFISTAVLRTADAGKMQSAIAQVLSDDDSLAAIVRQQGLFARELSRGSMHDVLRKLRNENIRVQTVQLGPSGRGTAFAISFRYSDRFAAQRVTAALVARFIGAPQSGTEVLDPASDPQAPSSPNRLQMAILGTIGGTLLGLAASRFRRAKLATA